MERLTIRTPKGAAVKMGEPANEAEARKMLMENFHKVCEKLAHYEDLEEKCIEETTFGLATLLRKWKEFQDDIAQWLEWRELAKQGRLVVLPCKVGDYVYDTVDGIAYKTKVVQFTIFEDRIACKTVSSYPDVDSFGKRVFLTEEEAEAALKGGDRE